MAGNVVLLGFATPVSGLSVILSSAALVWFLIGAVLGGRIMSRASGDSPSRFAAEAFLLEVVVLAAASLCAIGYKGDVMAAPYVRSLALIALTALAMGLRNATVRKLAIPDVTTTVLTLTLTAIAADSSLANGNNVRLARRLGAILAMFAGAALGAIVIRYSIAAALGLAAVIAALCNAAFSRSLRTADRL